MAGKFLTTQNKKIIATISLLIVGWHALIMNNNPFNIPMQPGWVSSPLIAGVSLLFLAGVVAILTIIMIWTEY